MKDKVREDLQDRPPAEPHRGRSSEQLDDKDRRDLDRVVRERSSK